VANLGYVAVEVGSPQGPAAVINAGTVLGLDASIRSRVGERTDLAHPATRTDAWASGQIILGEPGATRAVRAERVLMGDHSRVVHCRPTGHEHPWPGGSGIGEAGKGRPGFPFARITGIRFQNGRQRPGVTLSAVPVAWASWAPENERDSKG